MLTSAQHVMVLYSWQQMQSMKSVDLIGHIRGDNSTVAVWPDPPSAKGVACVTRWSCLVLMPFLPCQASHISWLHHSGMGSPPLYWRSTCSDAPSVSTSCNLWDGGKRDALLTWWVTRLAYVCTRLHMGHSPYTDAYGPHTSSCIQNHPKSSKIIHNHPKSSLDLTSKKSMLSLMCHLLKCLPPGSRFLIGKKCAWLLDCSLLKRLITWFITGQRSSCCRACFIYWFSQFRRLPWFLDGLSRKALITWFNFDSILIQITSASTRHL